MSGEARPNRVWEVLVLCSVAPAIGIGDFHLALMWHAPRSVALWLGIFLGVWSPFSLRLRP